MHARLHGLDPHDALFVAIVLQAIKDYQKQVGKHYEPAQSFLTQMGILDNAGEIVEPTAEQVAQRLG